MKLENRFSAPSLNFSDIAFRSIANLSDVIILHIVAVGPPAEETATAIGIPSIARFPSKVAYVQVKVAKPRFQIIGDQIFQTFAPSATV